jgi:NADH:ubiquinone oxidoreductase subunit K
MDELDQLKSAWKTQDYSEHKVSTKDIFKILHTRSSSYVKWIFYISIIEVLVINSFVLFTDFDKSLEVFDGMGLHNFFLISTTLSYVIIIGFIYIFYRNYKTIKVDSNARTLMNNIIRTRKTVKYYIYYNIAAIALSSAYTYYVIFSNDENIRLYKQATNMGDNFSNTALLIILIISILVIVALFLLFYRVIYGILLRRLKKNFEELELLDN